MKKKLKVSQETVDCLLQDIHELTELTCALVRRVEELDARLAVCEAKGAVRARGAESGASWYQSPVVKFQGKGVAGGAGARDAGEQANL